MSKNKINQNGITLIALVITIIVMLILVGVTVNLALNGGLFSTAEQAKSKTQLALEEERLLELAIGAIGADGKVVLSDLDEAVLADGNFTGSNGTYTSVKSGNTFTVSEYGSVTQVTAQEPTGYQAYSIGDEVTVGGENFFVIADSDETESTVTLLAKYNLNKAGTAQSNVTSQEYSCAFSSTNYWSTIEGITYPYDLNNTPTSADTDAIAKARTYGTALGGTGRLLTLDEASTLSQDYSGIISGTTIDAVDGYLDYWLGTASNSSAPKELYGGFGGIIIENSYNDEGWGVRPVVEISKDKIS